MQTARLNNASKARFENHALNNPFASGSFRWVAKGVYTEGNRAGEACVCKWFKTGGVMESHFYDTDIAASKEAVFLITKFNSKGCIDRMVKVNLPEVWTLMHIADTILLDAKFYRNLSLPVIKSSTQTQSTLASGDASSFAFYPPHLEWTKAIV